ncbi:class I SAM-dependent methyltransferase [Streptomyces lancefieldiae]|uniref:Class I SAM-dependent methyltransferase n=1 Tax=Streptomyces lancefieldiae TaxID=3075520 RepID=A0ABU3B4Y9_9ACTN|nr:class I SAM-dependent methyltransferase [Streptomyces sp. DSM 40712]MDT0616066.1 class I SAM-dependent methyltransferase [Streptomyces sp. DSM 40712]
MCPDIPAEVVYQENFAEIYDDIYRSHRDYAGEAERIRRLVRERHPAAASLLDVACGTGEHLVHLGKEFEVQGVDLAEPMLRAAVAKLGAAAVHRGDMRDLELGRRFDAVTCLFSSIAYLGGVDELRAAVRSMAAHLVPGGVMVIEPWILREDWNGGDLVQASFTSGTAKVSRMGHWYTVDGRSRVEMHYLVADPSAAPATAVRHFVNQQDLALFSREEYEAAVTGAGCAVEYLSDGYADRGVFVGVRQA